ncbi:hypothetical protein NUSPORA_02742 [Nucleospora cyclopteri]
MVDCKASSLWLKKESIITRDEAALYFLQKRNLFYGNKSNCAYYKSVMKIVEHLATRCDRMLAFHYTQRQNEIEDVFIFNVFRIQFKSSKKKSNHSEQEIVCNEEIKNSV